MNTWHGVLDWIVKMNINTYNYWMELLIKRLKHLNKSTWIKKGEKKIVLPCDPVLTVDPLNASLVWDKYR